MFTHPCFDAHERVLHLYDAASGLKAIIAIHDTRLGPAFGGCRLWPYASEADALTDALRLSRGMTYKSAICELPYGGGKSVIIGDPARDKTEAMLLAMARAVEELDGRYIIADDVGTTLKDLALMRTITRHTAAASASAQQPLGVTAYGVYQAMRAAVEVLWGSTQFTGLRVAVQGLGNVGWPLCQRLHEQGTSLLVSDLDPRRVQAAVENFDAIALPPDAIYEHPADIFSPCALGSILDEDNVTRLGARLICGGANNQLAHDAIADAIHQRGILYIPDFLANAGGVIDFHQERIDDSPQAVLHAVERIGRITARLLREATASGTHPCRIATDRVRARLATAA